METKKKIQFDLESKRGLFFRIGLITALGITFLAFEWKSYDSKSNFNLPSLGLKIEEEDMIPITRREDEIKLMPVSQVQVVDFNVVANESNVESAFTNFTSEADVSYNILKVETFVENETVEVPIFRIVQKMPTYPGDDVALFGFIYSQIKYPDTPKTEGIQGVVYVNYVIDEMGNTTDVSIEKGVDPYLDAEAMRVIKLINGYKPGEQMGRKVKVKFTIPIRFELRN